MEKNIFFFSNGGNFMAEWDNGMWILNFKNMKMKIGANIFVLFLCVVMCVYVLYFGLNIFFFPLSEIMDILS